MLFDPEQFGQAMGEAIRRAVEPLHAKIAELRAQLEAAATRDAERDMQAVKAMIEDAVKSAPAPADGKDGRDGKDGAGVADLMIDREGALVATMTDGRMKRLGVVVGRDGADGKDGKDGSSLESFELEYLPDTHEIAIKATCAGRVRELRHPAGGIRPGGYWREGVKAQAAQTWTHNGSTWLARRDTSAKPESRSDDWTLMARAGRDGETTVRHVKDGPPEPIKLKG